MIKFMGIEVNGDECNRVGFKRIPNVGLCYHRRDDPTTQETVGRE